MRGDDRELPRIKGGKFDGMIIGKLMGCAAAVTREQLASVEDKHAGDLAGYVMEYLNDIEKFSIVSQVLDETLAGCHKVLADDEKADRKERPCDTIKRLIAVLALMGLREISMGASRASLDWAEKENGQGGGA